LGDGRLCGLGGNEEAADEPFVVFENVETVAGRAAVVEGSIAAEGARVYKAANQVDRGTVIPEKLIAPMACFFLEENLKRARMELAKVDDLHQAVRPRVIIYVIDALLAKNARSKSWAERERKRSMLMGPSLGANFGSP
jgi:hypothetical protein